MRSVKMIIVSAVSVLLVLVAAAFVSRRLPLSKSVIATDTPEKGFVLLELFTSEGCSSCPAADELLAKIQNEAHDKPVYVLAYHVDYWNRLGWKDQFSDAKFSKRQSQYGRWLKNAQIYTPQVVVNGKAEYVGSDKTALQNAVTKALSVVPAASIAMQANQSDGKLSFNYQITGELDKSQLLVALVQKQAISKVAAGENNGKTLKHAQIVRNLYQLPLANGKGSGSISIPKEYNPQTWEVITFVQNSTTGEVLSANRVTKIGTADSK